MILPVGRSQGLPYSSNTGDLALFSGDVYFLMSLSVVISKDFETFIGWIFKMSVLCYAGKWQI